MKVGRIINKKRVYRAQHHIEGVGVGVGEGG